MTIIKLLITVFLLAGTFNLPALADSRKEEVARRLEVIVPQLSVTNTTLAESLEFLQKQSAKADPENEGVPIVYRLGDFSNLKDTRCNFNLSNVSLGEAFHFFTSHCGVAFTIEDEGVVIVPKGTPGTYQPPNDEKKSLALETKLNSIVIPKLNFKNTTLREAVLFLRLSSQRADPTMEGVNIVLSDRTEGSMISVPIEVRLFDLSLNDVSVKAALDAIAARTGTKYKIQPESVVVVPGPAD